MPFSFSKVSTLFFMMLFSIFMMPFSFSKLTTLFFMMSFSFFKKLISYSWELTLSWTRSLMVNCWATCPPLSFSEALMLSSSSRVTVSKIIYFRAASSAKSLTVALDSWNSKNMLTWLVMSLLSLSFLLPSLTLSLNSPAVSSGFLFSMRNLVTRNSWTSSLMMLLLKNVRMVVTRDRNPPNCEKSYPEEKNFESYSRYWSAL